MVNGISDYCFRPLIGVNFCKRMINPKPKEIEELVSVPLSGLISVNPMWLLGSLRISLVSVPLSGLISVNDIAVCGKQYLYVCFRPLIGVNFCKLYIYYDLSNLWNNFFVSVPLSGLISVNKEKCLTIEK